METSEPPKNSAFRSKHVLIVEDHEDTVTLLRNVFETDGFRVTTASNGREALDLLLDRRGDEPTVVLLDLNMPTMSGSEFFELTQLSKRLGSIPVIVITATNDRLDHPNIVGHIRKPFDPYDVLRAARAAIERVGGAPL